MSRRQAAFLFVLLVSLPLAGSRGGAKTAPWRLLAWNDLGMHCTDGTDFSVFAILPPYNNVHAQLVGLDGTAREDAGHGARDVRGGGRPGPVDQHDVAEEDQLLAVRERAVRR